MIRFAKKELRNRIKEVISEMSSEDKRRQSEIIFKKLIKENIFNKSSITRIGLYLSLEREVDTKPILHFLFSDSRRIRYKIFVPKYEDNSREMDFFELLSMSDFRSLPETKWRIKQMSSGDTWWRSEALIGGGLDVMIVPGVAFTANGDRIGNGFGYYDNYFRRLLDLNLNSNKTLLIGLSFRQQLVDYIPRESHDIRLDLVLSSD